jgi:ATP-binding cassette, subfamily B, bacterial CvaB/MchF/RaxB
VRLFNRPPIDLPRLDTALIRHATPVVLQTEAAECGLVCLAMVAARYGHRMDVQVLRQRYNLSLKGMTLREMVRLADSLQLATRALRAEIPHLKQVRLPAVLHWDHSHFVVLTRVGPRGATIHDPAMGRRKITLDELSKHFTGIVLEVWPTAEFRRKVERARVKIRDLIGRTWGFWPAAIRVMLVSLVIELIVIALPIGFQIVIDEVVVSSDRDLLLLIALGLVFLVTFRSTVEFVRSWAILVGGATLALQWKTSLFKHLLRLPLSFFERRNIGDVASRFTSIDRMQQTLSAASVSGLVDGVMAVVLIVMMWIYDGRLAAIAVGTTALYAVMRGVAYKIYRRVNEEAIVATAQENSHFIETLRGMPSIKALGIGDRRQATWTNFLNDRISAELRTQRVDTIFTTVSNWLFGLDRVLIIYLGARAVIDGGFTIGMLVAFLAYKDQFSQRAGQSFDTIVRMGMLSVHGERISDIALAKSELGSDDIGTQPVTAFQNAPATLAARAVGFRYGDNEQPIVSQFNLEVAAGECVAIVGPSGAGKTTLLKMLAGLLTPTEGAVLLDGIPLSAIGLESYRTQIGCVLQDDRLFAGSIAENIAAFAPSFDLQQVQSAAQMASIHNEILRMPMGYETLVGDMGSSLSGGQVQRIVMARALFRQPRILLLDEATSHLDEENERAINEAVQRLPIARIIVAHRRSTLDMADRVVPVWPAAAQSLSVSAGR